MIGAARLSGRRSSPGSAFTLIEVLIVVAIMGIIAAIIMPQMMASALDARDSALAHNLQVLRKQIDLFKVQHNDHAPGFANQNPEDHLLKRSNSSGEISDVASVDFPWGPYFVGLNLINPFNHASHLKISDHPAQETPDDGLTDGGRLVGWFYNPVTSQISPNAEGNAPNGVPRVQQ